MSFRTLSVPSSLEQDMYALYLFFYLTMFRAMAHRTTVLSLKHTGGMMLEEDSSESINRKWQCDPRTPEELNEDHNDYHLRGVNLGSWMVLEPWITPSMFFQFLGKEVEAGGSGESKVAMDMYTFCTALGPEEGNKQLRRHWGAWVTEADIAQLATLGINAIRLPVGDWMYKPYGPYIGCTDGALEEMDRLFDLCRRYGIRVLLDIHALAGSQNGFDNSGHAMDVRWTSYSGSAVSDEATFAHWPSRAARWIGDWDADAGRYTSRNDTAIEFTLSVIQTMVDMYANETVVMGLQPVNEPWQFTPIDWLKDFYWAGYKIVREQAPRWLYLMHDSFRFDANIWGDFMKNCPSIGLDTHVYQAWDNPGPQASYLAGACDTKHAIEAMEARGMPVVVGEWSLATDNCAMWLNGWQDNLPGYPKVQCEYVRCPIPYMGSEQPGAPLDPRMPPTGPFGTGSSTPSYGMCPIDASWHAEDDFMESLAYAKLHAFEAGHGWFFWNFKTELEVRWDYMAATEKGYFPYRISGLEENEHVKKVCTKFDGRTPMKNMPTGIYAEKEDSHQQPTPLGIGTITFMMIAFLGVATFAIKVVQDMRRDAAAVERFAEELKNAGLPKVNPTRAGYQEEYIQIH